MQKVHLVFLQPNGARAFFSDEDRRIVNHRLVFFPLFDDEPSKSKPVTIQFAREVRRRWMSEFKIPVHFAFKTDGDISGPVWSPKATIAGGFQALQSIQTEPGVYKLLIGPNDAGTVLARDSSFTTFTDNSEPYSSWFTIGGIVLAHPGQMAQVGFLAFDEAKTASLATISMLSDEIPGDDVEFTVFEPSVSDPPKLYGPFYNDNADGGVGAPESLWMTRYMLNQSNWANADGTPATAWMKFCFIKVDFGDADRVQNEVFAFDVYGALWDSGGKG